jgi:hypothetical protein
LFTEPSGISLITGQDVSIANYTAGNAVDHNLSQMVSEFTERDVYGILERNGYCLDSSFEFQVDRQQMLSNSNADNQYDDPIKDTQPNYSQNQSEVADSQIFSETQRMPEIDPPIEEMDSFSLYSRKEQEELKIMRQEALYPEIAQAHLEEMGTKEEYVQAAIARKAYEKGRSLSENEQQIAESLAFARYQYTEKAAKDQIITGDLSIEIERAKDWFAQKVNQGCSEGGAWIEEQTSKIGVSSKLAHVLGVMGDKVCEILSRKIMEKFMSEGGSVFHKIHENQTKTIPNTPHSSTSPTSHIDPYHDHVAHSGYYERKEERKKILNATPADCDKHTKALTTEKAILLSSTGSKPPAQYMPGINNHELERQALRHGIKVEDPSKGATYYYYKSAKPIGYDGGEETQWIRAELTSGNVFHGHPVNDNRLPKFIKEKLKRED